MQPGRNFAYKQLKKMSVFCSRKIRILSHNFFPVTIVERGCSKPARLVFSSVTDKVQSQCHNLGQDHCDCLDCLYLQGKASHNLKISHNTTLTALFFLYYQGFQAIFSVTNNPIYIIYIFESLGLNKYMLKLLYFLAI